MTTSNSDAPVTGDPSADANPADGQDAEVTLSDVLARLDKIESDTAGRTKALVADLARLRKKVGAAEPQAPEPTGQAPAAGTADLKSEVKYELMLEGIEDDSARREIEEMHAESGPKAAIRLAKALTKAQGETPSKSSNRNPVRAGTAAPPPSARAHNLADVLKLPEAERKAVLERVRKGEDSFSRP